ncbi:MAG: hypothetical protein CMJ51_01605 [Planctomycetaceae bacterium]|nr:hypothetical protein [Planctomycetaceae bacterium]
MNRRGLWNKRFVGLVLTQFAGATNDNILKSALLLAVAGGGTWSGSMGPGGTGYVNLMLTVPFVLLLGWAGQMADRWPKDRIIIVTRIFEVPIGILALLGFFLDDPWIVLSAFALLASESAFFSPAKYGCIPEIVDEDRVNEANGFVNMTTNIAILLGIAGGGILLQIHPLWVGIAIPVLAVFGLLSSLLLRGLSPVAPDLPWQWNPFGPYLTAIRLVRPGLVWKSLLAWSWFYAAAIVVLAVIPEYRPYLHLDAAWASYLLAAVGLGIGIGCLLAGRVSGDRIRGGFVALGGLGTGLIFCLLGILKPTDLSFWELWGCLLLAGVTAGFFLIPLQAIQQLCSPAADRARVLGTANAMSFLLMSIASGLYSIVVPTFGLAPTRATFACGILLLTITAWIRFGGGRLILTAKAPVLSAKS